jgi:hypothetical protein
MSSSRGVVTSRQPTVRNDTAGAPKHSPYSGWLGWTACYDPHELRG